MRLGFETGRGLNVRLTPPPDAPMQPLDDYTRKLIQTRRRGLVYPYELVPMLAGEGGSFVEHDLDDDGRLVPVDRPPGQNRAGVVVGVVRTPTARYPEGITRVAVLGDPTKAMGSITEAECTRAAGGDRPGRGDGRADRVVRPVGRGQDRHGLGQREPRLGRPRAAPARRAHAGRRRGRHRRRRHQRRRPAVLERRVDDAHAHPRHPRDDARQRDGADRQAGHRLLGRRVGRGQPRHRRLRPGDGTERRGAVLGAEPGRGVRGAVRAPRADVPGAGGAVAAAGRHRRTRSTATCARRTARRRGRRLRHRRRHLLGGAQPRPQEAVRHPHADGRHDRPGPRAARALAGDGRGRDGRGLRRPPRRPRRVP